MSQTSPTQYIVFKIPQFMAEVLALMFFMLLLVNVLTEVGLFDKLTRALAPISRIVKIPEEYVLCISLCLVTPSLGYATLLKVMEDRSLKSEDVFPILILSSPVTQLCDTLRFGVPIALSVLGPLAGILYAKFSISRALARLLIHSLYVKFRLAERIRNLRRIGTRPEVDRKLDRNNRSLRMVLLSSLRRTWKIFRRIALRLAIVTAILVVLAILNAFQYLGQFLKPVLEILGFNQYMITVVVVQLMNFIAALYTAGAFYSQGLMTLKQVLLTIYAGQLITMPIMYFRQFLPYRASLFGFKVALRWVMFDTLTSFLTTLVIVLIILYIL